MGGWFSSNADIAKTEKKFAKALIELFDEDDCICHLDPDMGSIKITDDYIDLSLRIPVPKHKNKPNSLDQQGGHLSRVQSKNDYSNHTDVGPDNFSPLTSILPNDSESSYTIKKRPITYQEFFTSETSQSCYLISAPPGGGKSVLMHHIATRAMSAIYNKGTDNDLNWPFDWVLLVRCRDFARVKELLKKDRNDFSKLISLLCFENFSFVDEMQPGIERTAYMNLLG